jgi:hypothetical protein
MLGHKPAAGQHAADYLGSQEHCDEWRSILRDSTTVATAASEEKRAVWRALLRRKQIDDDNTVVIQLSERGSANSPRKSGGEEEDAVNAASLPPLELEKEVGTPLSTEDKESEYYSCSYTSMMASGRRGGQ